MQVGFIDSICMPVYEAFAKMSDRLNPLLEGCKQNKTQWTDLAERDLDPWKNNTFVVMIILSLFFGLHPNKKIPSGMLVRWTDELWLGTTSRLQWSTLMRVPVLNKFHRFLNLYS